MPTYKELALERCCRQLVNLGKRQGGYLTYEAIVDIFRASECEVAIEVLDWVYERLTAEGIELVDELPDSTVALGHFPEGRQSVQEDLQRLQAVPRRQRNRPDYSSFEEVLDQLPCHEEVIDELFWQVENGSLSAAEILMLIEKCAFSELEISQLLEYLGSKGLDVPDTDFFDALKRVPEQYGFLQDEDELVLFADPGVQLLLRDMAGLQRLTAKEERELARLVEEGDQEASSRLIEANLWHVFHLATNYLGMGLDFLDLFQEGCIGLMKAVGKFDWRFGNRLSSYASWWIIQTTERAIFDHGRAIRLPVHMIETIRRLQNVTDYLYQVYGREPTTNEIAKEMGLPEWKVSDLQIFSQAILSWEAILTEWEEMVIYPTWFLEKYGKLPDEEMDLSVVREIVSKILGELTPKEQEVLRLRFGLDGHEPQTLEDIGRYFGVTRERVRQIEARALKRLRHPKRLSKMRGLLQDSVG